MHKYIFDCCYDFAVAPSSVAESAPHFTSENEDDAYDIYTSGGATDLVSAMVALPTEGGQFPVADYVGPELAAYAFAQPPACNENDLVPITNQPTPP